MEWNDHSKLRDLHSFMSPSQGSWLDDNDEEFLARYSNYRAKERGTELHAWAAKTIDICIEEGLKLQNNKSTLAMYINDAIGFGMRTEQPLFYSENCFGTADAISFLESKKILRIHDLKTGKTQAKMRQLYIYAALFCLEYGFKPSSLKIETRIYQNDSIMVDRPTTDIILPIMDNIVHKDKLINGYSVGGIEQWVKMN